MALLKPVRSDVPTAVAKVIHEKDEEQHNEELESTEENNTNSEQ